MRPLIPALILLIGGCAGTTTRAPQIAADAVVAEQKRLHQLVVDEQLAMLQRLQSLAWPILKANADLCGKATRPALGATLTDARLLARQIRGLRRQDIPLTGITIAAVAEGSPAMRAGLRPGQVLQGNSVKQVSRDLALALKKNATARLTLADGSSRSVTPEKLCAFPVRLVHGNSVNAFTNGSSLVFFTGMLRAVPDDTQIQMVIAHELAHAMLKHPRKGVRNSLLSGGWLLGTVAAGGGWLIDTLADVTGSARAVSYRSLGARLATWPYGRDFEREADYVATYLLVRAGVKPDHIEGVFESISSAAPASTWVGLSHPITPERIVAARAARAEIARKQTQGHPLLPEGWRPSEKPAVSPSP